MNRALWSICIVAFLAVLAGQVQAQVPVKSENFQGTTTNSDWYFFNGACLTASSSAPGTNPGNVPGCMGIQSSYYKNEALVGGQNGVTGSSTTLPDPNGQGALRLTNGYPGGYQQNGAIVSSTPFPTSQGIQITFKTVTYRGDSGGAGKDGADGISFYLMDASKPAGIGAWGGSLGYTCSNSNPPYDGLVGAYLGLGIDEYGNFLNGSALMSGYTGTNSATGDNTALGYGYKPGRVGMRGAGSVAWSALTAAYGTNPNSSTSPYYPASLANTCPSGFTWDSATSQCLGACDATSPNYSSSKNQCASCGSGFTYSQNADKCGQCSSGYTYDSIHNSCNQCASGTYDSTSGKCINICAAGSYDSGTNKCINICTSGVYNAPSNSCKVCSAGVYDATPNKCQVCNTSGGYTYSPSDQKCHKGSSTQSPTTGTLTTQSPTTQTPTTASPSNASLTTQTPTYSNLTAASISYTRAATQKTCSTGHLWNYSNPTAPTDAGAATLANPVNTAGILDYAPIPNGYTELSSLATPFTIAKESAMKRGDADAIFYNLKITQDGLLSLAYSINGGSYVNVIKNQDISVSNGPVPSDVFFGLAGSTGGSTNIHEIMCFKASPTTLSGSSTSVNEKISAKVEAGTQAYFAFYDPNNWTGSVTANALTDTGTGDLTISALANWDAGCVLNGTTAADGCINTGATGATTALSPSSRVILTCRGNCSGSAGNTGVALQYANLSSTQQNALNAGDSLGSARVDYLRGDRTNEITSANPAPTGKFRNRDSVLGDIVDSSPIWVGAPQSPYTAKWTDRLPANPSSTVDSMVENSGTQSYQQYLDTNKTRLNVVYGGANDGLVHGFRTGSFDANGSFVNNVTTPNDGKEVLAYMPGFITRTIHSITDPNVDFSGTQYGHAFYVDATPTAEDLFYGGTWHTWLVGGLGQGGGAIYALDVTDPTAFKESNAANIVIGEWRATTISCATPGGTTCGGNLGLTYGTPAIRRLHNGKWGVIFGNGFGGSTNDGGIYIMTVDQTTAAKTFYYLTTNQSGGNDNGIAFVSPVDLDGDHITDYVYAGDLQGNIWKFDLTSTDPTNWSAGSGPIFTTASGQPITSKVQVVFTILTGQSVPQVMLEFGTGQKTLLTNSTPNSFATGTQSLYGIWDWDFSGWNAKSSVKYRSVTAATAGLSSPLARSNLTAQNYGVSTNDATAIAGSNNAVCWMGIVACPSPAVNNKFGWYADLRVVSGQSEQAVFNPLFFKGAFIINTTLPATNIPTSCSVPVDRGFTYVINVDNGGAFSNVFPSVPSEPTAVAVETGGVGTGFPVTVASQKQGGQAIIVFEKVTGEKDKLKIDPPPNGQWKRLTWAELR